MLQLDLHFRERVAGHPIDDCLAMVPMAFDLGVDDKVSKNHCSYYDGNPDRHLRHCRCIPSCCTGVFPDSCRCHCCSCCFHADRSCCSLCFQNFRSDCSISDNSDTLAADYYDFDDAAVVVAAAEMMLMTNYVLSNFDFEVAIELCPTWAKLVIHQDCFASHLLRAEALQ